MKLNADVFPVMLNDFSNLEAQISKSVCARFDVFEFQNHLRDCLRVFVAAV